MAVIDMKKVSLAVAENDLDALTRDIAWVSSLEITPYAARLATPEWSALLTERSPDAELTKLESAIKSVAASIAFASPHNKTKKGMFALKEVISRGDVENDHDFSAKCSKLDSEIAALIKISNELHAEENRLNTQKTSLEPWIGYDAPLSLSSTRSTEIILGTFPGSIDLNLIDETINSSVNVDMTHVSKIGEYNYIALVWHEDSAEDALSALSQNSFTRIVFKDIDTTAQKRIQEIDIRILQIAAEYDKITTEIELAAQSLADLEKYYDILTAKTVALAAKAKFLRTASTSVIEGFVPAKKTAKLEKIFAKYNCYYEFCDPLPEEYENVPVLLENNNLADPFEAVIALYSYPAYKTIDPMNIMAVFYFLIFGLMLADFVYGLILTVGCFMAIRLMKPKLGMHRFLKMFGICGISSMIGGILFGSYLGDLPSAIAKTFFGFEGELSLAILFDPIKDPMTFLVIAMAVGVLHLVTGLILKMYKKVKAGDVFGAIFDVGSWLVLFAGVGLMFVSFDVAKWIAIAGAAMLILTQGRAEKNPVMKLLKGIMSLYDSVSYIADLLSYSRILALGLSGAVIAQVFNLMGTMGGGGIVGVIILIVIGTIGHGLNLALSVLGTFVHAARLQYIEFFNKFYEDGGRPFAPVTHDTKYTRINFEEEYQ